MSDSRYRGCLSIYFNSRRFPVEVSMLKIFTWNRVVIWYLRREIFYWHDDEDCSADYINKYIQLCVNEVSWIIQIARRSILHLIVAARHYISINIWWSMHWRPVVKLLICYQMATSRAVIELPLLPGWPSPMMADFLNIRRATAIIIVVYALI